MTDPTTTEEKRQATLDELSDALDRQLLAVVREGVDIIRKDKVIHIPASAAYLEAARKRLRDVGPKKPAASDALIQLAQQLDLHDRDPAEDYDPPQPVTVPDDEPDEALPPE